MRVRGGFSGQGEEDGLSYIFGIFSLAQDLPCGLEDHPGMPGNHCFKSLFIPLLGKFPQAWPVLFRHLRSSAGSLGLEPHFYEYSEAASRLDSIILGFLEVDDPHGVGLKKLSIAPRNCT